MELRDYDVKIDHLVSMLAYMSRLRKLTDEKNMCVNMCSCVCVCVCVCVSVCERIDIET